MLIHIYAVHAFPASALPSASNEHDDGDDDDDVEALPRPHGRHRPVVVNGHANGKAGPKHGASNGTAMVMGDKERRSARDAHEFELDSLISDEDAEGAPDTDALRAGWRKGEDEGGRVRL